MSSRRLGWIAMLLVVIGALVVGGLSGDNGPRTTAQRVDSIAKTIKCPSCRSESVFESRAASAENIKTEISRLVGEGTLSDDQIREQVTAPFGEDLLLTPPSSGVAGLVWVLPVVALICAIGGLVVVFRKWRVTAAPPVSDDDRALVDAALERDS